MNDTTGNAVKRAHRSVINDTSGCVVKEAMGHNVV